jgi:hypothetical protein
VCVVIHMKKTPNFTKGKVMPNVAHVDMPRGVIWWRDSHCLNTMSDLATSLSGFRWLTFISTYLNESLSRN